MESKTTETARGEREDHGQPSWRSRRVGKGREVEYMVKIRPKVEALMGIVEELLLGTAEIQRAHEGGEHEEAPCSCIVGMLMHG